MLITQNKNLNSLSYGFSILFIAVGGIQQYLTSYFNDLGEPSMGFNVLFIIYFAVFISNFYASYFIERFSMKSLILISSFIYILAHLAIAMESHVAVYGGALVVGLVGAILWNSQNGYLLAISNQHNRGKNSGFFMAIYEIGSSSGIFFVGYFSGIYGYQIAFFVVAFLSLFSFFFFNKMEHLSTQRIEKKISNSALFKSLTLIRIALLNSFIYFMIIGLAISILPLQIHLLTDNGLAIGLLSGGFFFMPILVSEKAGRYSDKHGRAIVVWVSIVLAIIGLVILHFSKGLLLLSVGTLFLALAQSFLAPIFTAVQGDISTVENQPFITTVFIFLKYIGLLVGVAVGSVFGLEWTYLIVIFIIGMALLVSWELMADLNLQRERILDEFR